MNEDIGLPAFIGRWIAVVPAALVGGVVLYFVASIANGVGGELASGIVWLLASGAAGAGAVGAARYVAPTAKIGTGMVVAAGLFILAIYLVVMSFTNQQPTYPTWYVVLVAIALMIGTLAGFGRATDEERLPNVHLNSVARWILFLPCALIVGFFVIAAIDVPIAWHFDGRLPYIIDIETRLLSGASLIGTATAIAPAGKKTIVCILGAIYGITGFLRLVGGTFQPLIFQFVSQHYHKDLYSDSAGWYVALQGLAWLLAAVIPIVIVFTNVSSQRQAQEAA